MDNKLLDELIINWYLNSSNKVVENKKLEIQDFKGDLVTRSFKFL